MSDYLPAGTATGNADAVRAAPIAQAFFLVKDIMAGIDAQPRMDPGMVSNKGLLGPTSSFGVDFGLDPNGDLYVRGRAAADAAPPRNTAQDGQAASSIQVPRVVMLVGLALGAYLVYRLVK